jgi:hypothetical protein
MTPGIDMSSMGPSMYPGGPIRPPIPSGGVVPPGMPLSNMPILPTNINPKLPPFPGAIMSEAEFYKYQESLRKEKESKPRKYDSRRRRTRSRSRRRSRTRSRSRTPPSSRSTTT